MSMKLGHNIDNPIYKSPSDLKGHRSKVKVTETQKLNFFLCALIRSMLQILTQSMMDVMCMIVLHKHEPYRIQILKDKVKVIEKGKNIFSQ